jgi:hypothetical protein
VGSFSASRIAHAEPNGLGFEVFCTGGSATFDVQRMSEFQISDRAPLEHLNGRRRVYVGPEHPSIARGIPMDALGVGHGLADLFVFQARSFLDEIAGIRSLPRCPGFADGRAQHASARSGHHIGHQWRRHSDDSGRLNPTIPGGRNQMKLGAFALT